MRRLFDKLIYLREAINLVLVIQYETCTSHPEPRNQGQPLPLVTLLECYLYH